MSMTPDQSKRFTLIHDLVTRQLEGTASVDDQKKLQDAITSDSEMRREYIRYMQETTHIASRLVPPHPDDEFSKSGVLGSAVHTDMTHGDSANTDDAPPHTVDRQSLSNIAREHRNEHRQLTAASRAHDAQTPGGESPGRYTVTFPSVASSFAIATSLLLAVTLAFWNNDRNGDQEHVAMNTPGDADIPAMTGAAHGTEVATLVECTNVVWDSQSNAVDELSRVGVGQNISFNQGRIKLVFDSGVETLVLAPCLLNIQDRNRVYCTYGRITAKASSGGKGFAIETPVARVTDLGTEFGIAIHESGETEVAVFEGEVDIELGSPNTRNEQGPAAKREHLVQGQATLVDHQGRSSRVFSIDNQRMPGVRDLAPLHYNRPVISAVRDNISERQPDSRMFYRIVHAGLREDSRAFVDRTHQWNGIDEEGIPRELIGADYVLPFNDDKFVGDLGVHVTIARPASVYIFFSNNTKIPAWLSNTFVDTGMDIGLDEGANRYKPKKKIAVGPSNSIDNTFSIWKREVLEPQELRLGSFEKPQDFKRGYNMYGIAAVAK